MENQQDKQRAEKNALAPKHQRGPHSKYSEEQQMLFLKAYLTKQASATELKKLYGVHVTQLQRWKRKFAAQNPQPEASQPEASAAIFAADANPTSLPSTKTPPVMAKKTPETPDQSSSEELARLRSENQRLRDQLQMKEWMVHAQDVMIEEAEKTFNIPIRKKSGAKR